MKLPKQSAAIERKSNRFAHVATGGRVRPSFLGLLTGVLGALM